MLATAIYNEYEQKLNFAPKEDAYFRLYLKFVVFIYLILCFNDLRMPKLKIDRIISFSSEDSTHTAANILLPEPTKKWKCASEGEKSANIILQLEKASVISNIDIGNENSAYVEVLVKRSGATDDFKVLLVMSSFMTPLESRQTTNANKVRMFGYNELQHPERDEKWDMVKIVCTQPFNRFVQYGLSFITLHTLDRDANKTATPNLGKFTLRPNSPNNLTTGNLFAKRNSTQPSTPPSAAAAIRDAPTSINLCQKPSKIKICVKESSASDKNNSITENDTLKRRNRDELLYSKDEEDAHEKIDNLIKKRKKELEDKQVIDESLKQKKKQAKVEKNSPVTNGKKEKVVPSTSRSEKKDNNKEHSSKKMKKRTKPFNHLLDGVTIVISGIQNPERSTIRSNALKLGAKYKPDWDDSCTHLICAFTNTPKFNQVKGKGKIVNRMWVSDCYTQRKRLPWRRYALDQKDLNQNESEEEIWESVPGSPTVEVLYSRTVSIADTDTDDEIERISTPQKQKQKARSTFSVDTDEEIYNSTGNFDIPELPSVLSQKTLYIDDELGEEQKRLLNRYIVALNGMVLDMPTEVDFIITNSVNANVLKEICSTAHTVTANWIWDSYNQKKLVPIELYQL